MTNTTNFVITHGNGYYDIEGEVFNETFPFELIND